VRTAEELIDRIVGAAHIPAGKRRREIQRELRAHIEDFAAAARDGGREQHEIEQMALANFGDPGQIAQDFAWVYRYERRRLRAFTYALSTVLVAGCLLLAILTIQAGLAFGLGTPIMKALASRHTVIEALDILASVGAYLGLTSLESVFESHRFQRATVLLTAIVAILMGSCAATGLHTTFLVFGLVNGVFCRAIQLFVTRKAARAGIVVICFPLAGVFLALLRAPVSRLALAATCVSWLVMGVGYLLMTDLSARIDAALLKGLERIQAS
jgi:hypothetical protein